MATPPPNYAQNFLSEISAEELHILFNKFRLFTYKKYGWLEDRYGFDLENVICESICAAFDGRRKWPSETKGIDFFKFICGIIYSNISHLLEKEGSIVMLYLDNSSASKVSNLELPSQSFDPDQPIYLSQLFKKLKDVVCSDPLLTQIALCLEEMPDMNVRTIAEHMGLPESKIRNAIKRLVRKGRQVREGENHE
jgi:DNA-directed RNA polymerase specialized sigma24 family protein